MNRIRTRSITVFIVAMLFILGLCIFTFRVATNADTWVQQNYNGHLSGSGGLEKAGEILDRSGVVLAQTVDGDREYNEDPQVRKAMLHAVGDNSLNISTAIQSTYRTELTGFSYVLGLGLPETFKSGRNITLTLDSKACKAAYEAMGDRRGAVVVYNYKTGEVLCMVSSTTYDPQDPPVITEENEDKYEGAYLNRALSSSYAPGSIFKVVTTAAAIDNIDGIMDKTFTCNGSVEIGGNTINCMSKHGTLGIADGLAKSCNVVFAELAVEIGSEKMTKKAEEMGFNSSFFISDIPTAKSSYDVSKADKTALAWSGVGQHTDLTNPMHMAILMGAVANGGTPVMPFSVESVSGIFGIPGAKNEGSKGEKMLSSNTAEVLDEMLRYNVTSDYGDSMFPSLTMCAKTGTAETGKNGESHAWMIGYSQDEDAPLAFAVVVENAGFGYSQAGPVAVAAMEACAKIVRDKA